MVKVDKYGVSHGSDNGRTVDTLEGTIVLFDPLGGTGKVFETDDNDIIEIVWEIAQINEDDEEMVEKGIKAKISELSKEAIAQNKPITCVGEGIEGLQLGDKHGMNMSVNTIVEHESFGQHSFSHDTDSYTGTDESYIEAIEASIRGALVGVNESHNAGIAIDGLDLDLKYDYVDSGFIYNGVVEGESGEYGLFVQVQIW